MKKLIFLTNIPAPYRHHLFNKIAKRYPNSLFVFSLLNEPDRSWGNKYNDIDYNYLILSKSKNTKMKRFNYKIIFILLRYANKDTVFFIGSFGSINGKLVILLSKIIKYKYVIWSDGEIFKQLNKNIFDKKCKSYNYADAIVVPGNKGKRYFEKFGVKPEKIFNSYFSHDVYEYKKFYNEKSFYRSKIRKKLNISEDDLVMITVSRFLDLKRLEDLRDALSILENNSNKYYRMNLILIGDGEHNKPVYEMIKKSRNIDIHWIKAVRYSNIPEYYAASDFMVFPSEGDIWGLVVNEALSMGLPVICTNIIGASKLVQDGHNGFIVPPRSPIIIAEKIQYLYNYPEILSYMSLNASSIYKRWNSDMAIDSIEKLIKYLEER